MKPDAPWFLACPVDNSDGTFTPPNADGIEGFRDRFDALAYAASETKQWGYAVAVFMCVPIVVTVTQEPPDDQPA